MEERGRKRVFPNFQEVEEDHQPSQTSSLPESAIVIHLRRLVSEEVDTKLKAYSHILQSSLSNSQLNEEATVSGFEKLRLCFLNKIATPIFTDNSIEAEDSEPLQVALIDATNFNAIVSMGPLSMAQIELFVLDGDLSEFDKRILSQRVGKRPLLVGNDLKLRLKNGVGSIKSLSFTDNSSWLRSKTFRMGVRVTDEKILAKFPSIGEAVCNPFRVLDRRGELNKKYHPPHREDEVWRLEGIAKNGVYHKNLSSQGIKTVDDLLKIYEEKGALYLKKLLGKKVPNKTWKAMVDNALECVPIDDNFAPSSEMKIFVGNEAVESGEVNGQWNSNDPNRFLETTLVGLDEEWEHMFNNEDP